MGVSNIEIGNKDVLADLSRKTEHDSEVVRIQRCNESLADSKREAQFLQHRMLNIHSHFARRYCESGKLKNTYSYQIGTEPRVL